MVNEGTAPARPKPTRQGPDGKPPVATWATIQEALRGWRRDGLRPGDTLCPSESKELKFAARLWEPRPVGQQLHATLRKLELIDEDDHPNETLLAWVGGIDDRPLLDAIRAYYPALFDAIVSRAPKPVVETLFAEIDAAPTSLKRFRSLLFKALAHGGVRTDDYRGLRLAPPPRGGRRGSLPALAPLDSTQRTILGGVLVEIRHYEQLLDGASLPETMEITKVLADLRAQARGLQDEIDAS